MNLKITPTLEINVAKNRLNEAKPEVMILDSLQGFQDSTADYKPGSIHIVKRPSQPLVHAPPSRPQKAGS